jgi:predicted dehydrogenase
MTSQPLRVGIVGLQPGRSWAAKAHVPALHALPADFVIAGIANTTLASAVLAAAALDHGARPFASVADLVASDIDVVSVTVKVPHHLDVVKMAITAGKHVYCEWPLGNGLAEAQELARLAQEKGVLGVVGTQACLSPEILYMKQLIADGFVGEVLSTTLIARGGGWGGVIPEKKSHAYLLDNTNGATMLTIPVGHALAGLRAVLGDVEKVSAVLATRRSTALVVDSGEKLPVTAPDQVLVSGVLTGGAPVSLHYRGGMPRDSAGLLWEINGTEGDLRVTGPFGHLQFVPLTLSGARGNEKAFQTRTVPGDYQTELPADPMVGNVARTYARMAADLRQGTRTAPSFDDAVALHRVIAAIETAAADGKTLDVGCASA